MEPARGSTGGGGTGGAAGGPGGPAGEPARGVQRIFDTVHRVTNPLSDPLKVVGQAGEIRELSGFVKEIFREGSLINLVAKVNLAGVAVNNTVRVLKLAWAYRAEANRLVDEEERSLALDRQSSIARVRIGEDPERFLSYDEVVRGGGTVTQHYS